VRKLAFGGVHVISPRIFDRLTERGAFSILDPYLRLAGEGETILPFRVDAYSWIDIGSPAQLEEARQRVRCPGAIDRAGATPRASLSVTPALQTGSLPSGAP
jgi:NDP-sugar pyrophosphorylase family protein